MMKSAVRRVLAAAWDRSHRSGVCTLFLGSAVAPDQKSAILRTAELFTTAGLRIEQCNSLQWFNLLRSATVLTAGGSKNWLVRYLRFIGRCRGIDPTTEVWAAWAWHEALARQTRVSALSVEQGRARLWEMREANGEGNGVVYIFGTGPSLDSSMHHDFSDGIRIICNTAVKNEALLAHIRPQIIVAGDALYHFGDSRHATAFRNDLYHAMAQHRSLFVCPSEFFPLLIAECPPELHSLIVPIPQGKGESFLPTLWSRYQLPNLGNVLNRLLIPTAIALGKDIRLLGFDGRKPSDIGFWENSHLNSYPELLEILKADNPAFFDGLVPSDQPNSYVNETLGQSLSENIKRCVRDGWRFGLIAPSALPGLASVPASIRRSIRPE